MNAVHPFHGPELIQDKPVAGLKRVAAAQNLLGERAQQDGVDRPEALAQERVIAQDQHAGRLQKLAEGERFGRLVGVPQGRDLFKPAQLAAQGGQDAAAMQGVLKNPFGQHFGARMAGGDSANVRRRIERAQHVAQIPILPGDAVERQQHRIDDLAPGVREVGRGRMPLFGHEQRRQMAGHHRAVNGLAEIPGCRAPVDGIEQPDIAGVAPQTQRRQQRHHVALGIEENQLFGRLASGLETRRDGAQEQLDGGRLATAGRAADHEMLRRLRGGHVAQAPIHPVRVEGQSSGHLRFHRRRGGPRRLGKEAPKGRSAGRRLFVLGKEAPKRVRRWGIVAQSELASRPCGWDGSNAPGWASWITRRTSVTRGHKIHESSPVARQATPNKPARVKACTHHRPIRV